MYLTTSSFFASPVRRAAPCWTSPFDRAFAQLARSFGETTHGVSGSWRDGAYELTVDLPGTAEDAIDVSVAGRTLTITVADGDSTWTRRLRLAQTLDPEQVSARYVNGRLTVTVGATAAPETRRVAIDTTPAPAVAELESSETPAVEPTAQSSEQNVTE